MYGDAEFSMHAEADGVVVNAPESMFRHEHWSTGEREMDDVYRAQNPPKRYKFGADLLSYRQAAGFPPLNSEALSERLKVVRQVL